MCSVDTVLELFEAAFSAVKQRNAKGNNEDKLLWFKLKAKLFERLLMKQVYLRYTSYR